MKTVCIDFMNYFKKNSDALEAFLNKTKNKIENGLNRMNNRSFSQKSGDFMPSLVKKILMNLELLTQEEKIIWSKDKNNLLRGIVIQDCIFSNYRIIIEKWNMPDLKKKVSADKSERFKISFVKGILNAERVEYIINFENNYDSVKNLFKTIEAKFSQQKN